ncbi:hypothetical protein FALCPG4_007987 [Fusarium falciforme]
MASVHSVTYRKALAHAEWERLRPTITYIWLHRARDLKDLVHTLRTQYGLAVTLAELGFSSGVYLPTRSLVHMQDGTLRPNLSGRAKDAGIRVKPALETHPVKVLPPTASQQPLHISPMSLF